jgi:hypothetical protein
MRLRIGVLAAGAALLFAGLGGGATPRPVVLGVSWQGTGLLSRVDARTLVPVGRKIDIGKPPTGLLARSPDGRTIALGHGSILELRFVDVRAMRATGRLRLPGLGSILSGIWPSPRRLVALQGGTDAAVLVVDPQARRLLERTPLDGEVTGAVGRGRLLLALLAPRGAIGQARLAVIGSDGRVRTIALPGVVAGFATPAGPDDVVRHASPGFAADPSGRRAVVVTPDALLTVDLETLAVTKLRSLERRPARLAKRIEGWGRRVLWLRGDRIVVTGSNVSSTESRGTRTTTGATLVQLESQTRRALDPSATGVELSGTTLLAYGGSALRGYRLDGSLRFELLRGRDTGYVQTAGRWAYVGSANSTRFTVVDVRAGRVVGTARTPDPTIVLGSG